ncbi:MAG: hypothetical protein AAGC60_07450 [Acidobacteriota bacterium]
MEPKEIKAALHEVERVAEQRGKTVHDSLYDEMANYSEHRVVRDLDQEQQVLALNRLGELAVELPGNAVGGGAFRDITVFICTSDFETCEGASRAALDLDASELRQRVKQGMAKQMTTIFEATRSDLVSGSDE